MEGLQPVVNLGGNDCNGWGGSIGGAAAGGFLGSIVGSWFGNGWGGGYGRGGAGGDCGGTAAATAAAVGNNYIMDSLTTMRSDLNGNMANLNTNLYNGFGTLAATTQAIGADLARGQCRTESAVLTTGLQGQIQQKDNTIFQLNASHNAEVQGMKNTYDLKSSIDNCCCTTNLNIERQGASFRELTLGEGCATRAVIKEEGDKTRALISQIERDQLLQQRCELQAEIAALKSKEFATGVAAAQGHQFNQAMQNQLTTLIQHMGAIAAVAATRPTSGSASNTPA